MVKDKMDYEVVNSKSGRTTEEKAAPRKKSSVLQALVDKFSLPVTAFDWLDPVVQVLENHLSSINDEDEEERAIMTIEWTPIIYSGSTKRFYPKFHPNNYVELEDAVLLDIDDFDRIDLSYLSCRLHEMVYDNE